MNEQTTKLIDFLKENKSFQDLSRMEILQLEIFGNSLLKILIALAIFAFIFFVVEAIDWFITQRLKKLNEQKATGFYQALILSLDSIGHFFYTCVGIYFGMQSLVVEEHVDKFLNSFLIALITIQIILSIKHLIRYFIIKAFKANQPNAGAQSSTAIDGIMLLVNIALWTLGALTILANFGVNITSLAASLGIGGIAIAFALQNILEDLFSSFSIYFDRPFEIGDFIISGTHSGTVKKIGLKTTRIKALQGEEIVISNKELTTSSIQNFKKLQERRFVFTLGATYDTSNEKLEKIPQIIKEICEGEELISYDRATFSDFADSSLNFEVVLFFRDGDYKAYMEARESVNLKIKAAFEKEGIDFAFPTQTLHVETNSST